MNIKYFAMFREITREKAFHLAKAPADMGALLELLSQRYGPAFRKAVFDGDALHTELILLVNGRNVRTTGELATPLADGDEVSVFPMVAGG